MHDTASPKLLDTQTEDHRFTDPRYALDGLTANSPRCQALPQPHPSFIPDANLGLSPMRECTIDVVSSITMECTGQNEALCRSATDFAAVAIAHPTAICSSCNRKIAYCWSLKPL